MVLTIAVYDGKTGSIKASLLCSSFTFGVDFTSSYASAFTINKDDRWMGRIALGDLLYISPVNLPKCFFDDCGYLGFVSSIKETNRSVSINAKDYYSIFDNQINQNWTPTSLGNDLENMMKAIKSSKCSPPWMSDALYDSSTKKLLESGSLYDGQNQDVSPWDLIKAVYNKGIIAKPVIIANLSIHFRFEFGITGNETAINIDQAFFTNLNLNLGGSDFTNVIAYNPSEENGLHTDYYYYIYAKDGTVEGPLARLDNSVLQKVKLPLKVENKYYSDEDFDEDSFLEEAANELKNNSNSHEISFSFSERIYSSEKFRSRPITRICHNGEIIRSTPRQFTYSNQLDVVKAVFGYADNTASGAIKRALSSSSSSVESKLSNLSNRIDSVVGGTANLNYNNLTNKPSIENIELVGNRTFKDLGLAGLDELDINSALTEAEKGK